MNHRRSLTPQALLDENSTPLSRYFASHEGCRILSTIANDESKLLQETKKILERKLLLDEQYAKTLQEITVSADRIAWPVNTHPVASVSREVFLQWSHLATRISTNAEQFRKNVIDDVLKELIEQKIDSKKFLEAEKSRYDDERRKAQSDFADAEKRFQDESKAYLSKNNELIKIQNSSRKSDVSRTKSLKDSVIEKRGNVYRAHNDYILKIREYNFVDEQYIRKIRNLLRYHEDVQLLLNKPWQNLLESIATYNLTESAKKIETSRQMISSLDLRRCYTEMGKVHSNILPLTTSPRVFDDALPRLSGLPKLKPNQFIGDSSTKQELKQRIDRSNNEPLPKSLDSFKDNRISYHKRKSLFEQEQQIDYLRKRRSFEEQLIEDFKCILRDVGYLSNDASGEDSDDNDDLTERLEDQLYFHGVIPRAQSVSKLMEKGDYLVRLNEKGQIILSVLWTDPESSNRMRDAHFIIHEDNQTYSFPPNSISKPSVHELISFYKRQKTPLREDGTKLIRPIARPDYIINNDEVQLLQVIGKGNFGEVTRGEYRGQAVAVKILHPSSADRSARDRQNFINEARLLEQYKHKNIVKFLGIAAIRDPLMIIMELVEQGALNTYLKAHDLRVSQLTQMCYDIAKGMEYLERCHVIHRDLATRNCLVDKKGRIKVADFGLSRALQPDEEYFVQIKQVPVRWWALEVFSEGVPYTNKSDVWSYGVTAWEVFSKAETPYGHIQTNQQVIKDIKQGERLKQPERCPPKIYTIVTHCWVINPKDRPTFEQLVERLKKEKSHMPHLLISTRIRLEPGPTTVGDERSDPEIMAHLDAKLVHEKCNNYSEYRTEDCARVVLDKLEKLGYRVISMTGIGQTCIWLLHKD